MRQYYIYNKVLGLAVAALTLVACSDTWDEHYNGSVTGVQEGSLWQAIKQDANLSNFASVIEACGYDKSLASSQVFTVFAPTNDKFSVSDAQELIAAYNAEKDRVSNNDNTVIKEFLQNHIALYNHSVSNGSNDSIAMMNGKFVTLTSSEFGGSKLLSSNALYGNGVLFTIDGKAEYFPNVFEYARKDSDLDSLYSFLYNDRFYRKEFLPEKSVAGDIVDGKTVYLDSVFRQQNDLFGYNFLQANLNTEDSTYWMVAPTNEVWKELVDEYAEYYNYDDKVDDRDSLAYTNPRMAIMKGMVFSRTTLTDAMLAGDSAVSTNTYANYTYRRSLWGLPELHYYQYNWLSGNNIFAGMQDIECSNGVVKKATSAPVNKYQTFFQWIIVEAEGQGSIREVKKYEPRKDADSLESVIPTAHYVSSDNAFYGKLWNDGYVEFKQATLGIDHWVTFNIPNVLSNIGYDIYVVTAPALANDSNATDIQRLPTRMKATLNYHVQDGTYFKPTGAKPTDPSGLVLTESIETVPDVVNYLLLAEDFKFPTCSYGLDGSDTQVSLTLETVVRSTERDVTFTRTMNIDCILLVPHGTMEVTDDGLVIKPHNDGFSYTIK